jgi:8-oxo-dGTP pyrophosphatase MutT (NUDIX family)
VKELTRTEVERRIRGFRRDGSIVPIGRQAAVAICVVRNSGEQLCVLVTRRSSGLRVHPGQFALPGGHVDEGEALTDAARRELREELGVDVGPEATCGFLDNYVTRSGYCITPVVMWAADIPVSVCANEAEVAEVYFVTLEQLAVRPLFHHSPESLSPVMALSILGTRVYAPTAAVLFQFAELAVHGRTTRVSGFEPPMCIWH